MFWKKPLALLLALALCVPFFAPAPAAYAASEQSVTVALDNAGVARHFFAPNNVYAAYNESEKAVQFSTTGGPDPYVYLNLTGLASIPAASYPYVAVVYRAPVTNSSGCGATQLFWMPDGVAPSEGMSSRFTAAKGYLYRSQIIDLSRQSYWKGTLTQLRVDPFVNGQTAWDTLYISAFIFGASKAAAQEAAAARVSAANGALDGMAETVFSKKAYDLAAYMEPLWDGNIVYNESVLPVRDRTGAMQPITLLYDADRVVSVRNSALNVEYVYGRDYEVQNGKLIVKTDGAIVTVPYESLHSGVKLDDSWWPCVDGTYTFVSEGHIFHDYQLAVTYTHSDGWTGTKPLSKTATLEGAVAKLTGRQSLKVVFYGDSITVGCNSSSYTGVAPKCPNWADLTVAQLKSVYGTTAISSVNTAKGGQLSDWGLANVEANVLKKKPDLLVLGFGMNDLTCGVGASDYQANIRGIIDAVRASYPSCEIILVAPMTPNPDIFRAVQSTQTAYLQALKELAAQYGGIAVADLTTAHRELLARKSFADISGNNVNHTNDFMTRVYAQTVTALLCGTEAGPGTPISSFTSSSPDSSSSGESVPPQTPLRFTVSADRVFAPDGSDLGLPGGNNASGSVIGDVRTDYFVLFGWLASSKKIVRFGYRYGNDAVIESEKYTTESAVKTAGAPVAGASGESSRFAVAVPVRAGKNQAVYAVAQLEDGSVIDLWKVLYNGVSEPTTLLASAFDSIALNGNALCSGNAPAYLASNRVSFQTGSDAKLTLSGWAHLNRSISGFGYKLDGGATVTGSFIQSRPDVKTAISQNAEGYSLTAAVGSLAAGAHKLEVVAIASDGAELAVAELPFTVTGKPGITTKSGVATVVTPAGLAYTAKGYQSVVNKASFKVKSGLVMTLSQTVAPSNRMSFTYSSTAPLKMTVVYTQNGAAVSDVFYLDAGTDKVFHAFIQGYLSGASVTEIKTIRFDTCNGSAATAILSDVGVESYPVYSSDVYYIENSRFKVGLQLSWGGGISYIEDKTHKENGLTNLINSHDTGRLVQQSYYGASSGSGYKPGSYNGVQQWPYNPVQGGDLYNNCSRLIDFVVSDSSVYLKVQPQDWALDGKITPSYMENVYTLRSDCIQVDNRFTDYSGMSHPVHSQEVPAFYTVSYLDRFNLYSGNKPWTGDTLASRSDLNFWGDLNYSADCTFVVPSGNTETWCAWTSSSSNFGIGLFVPNIDRFFAGRFSYDGSKSPSAVSTNYVAPLIYTALKAYTPLEYSYLITTGSVEQIRGVFSAHRNMDGSYLLDLSNAGAASLFTSRRYTSSTYSAAQNATQLKVTTNNDVYAYLNFDSMGASLSANDFNTISFDYMIPTGNSKKQYTCELFLCTGSVTTAKAGKSVKVELVADGKYHTASVNVGGLSFWSGQLHKIRVDYFDTCGKKDIIYLRSLTLS